MHRVTARCFFLPVVTFCALSFSSAVAADDDPISSDRTVVYRALESTHSELARGARHRGDNSMEAPQRHASCV